LRLGGRGQPPDKVEINPPEADANRDGIVRHVRS
jgi:hypothetical protein